MFRHNLKESSSLWTFILCLAFAVGTSVQGDSLVIGSNDPVIAAPGDDVILPCHLEPKLNTQGLTVEWSKPDLKPDPSDRLSRVEYVHLYRDGREVPDMKMSLYIKRTMLFVDDMKHGNISLKILNVTEADKGRYRCFIPKLRSQVNSAVVELVIDPSYGKTWTTETPLDPRNLQTPGPQDTTPAGRSRDTLIVVISIFILTVAAAVFAACFSHRLSSQKICSCYQRLQDQLGKGQLLKSKDFPPKCSLEECETVLVYSQHGATSEGQLTLTSLEIKSERKG